MKYMYLVLKFAVSGKDGMIQIFFYLPYLFGYKTELFYFQNNPKNLDLSYKTDLDLWDCLGRVKVVLQQHFIGRI